MKKTLLALVLMLCLCLSAAVAEEPTPLPFGMSYTMNWKETYAAAGENAQSDTWETEDDEVSVGSIYVEDVDIGVGTLHASTIYFEVNDSNSAREGRLFDVLCLLVPGDNVIASFRDALAQVSSVYGDPDNDPFDEESVAAYVEYGALSASWTRTDVRINLYMQRAYDDSLTLEFSNRLCFDADDLK